MIFKTIFIVIAIVAVLIAIAVSIKIGITNKHYNKIIAAIHQYNMDEIERCKTTNTKEKLIPYSCIRNFDKSLSDFRDWSDKHIVPRKVYRRIKPYFND